MYNLKVTALIVLNLLLLVTNVDSGPPIGNSGFCVPPAPPPNGKVSLRRGYVIVRYYCNAGFKLDGKHVAVCVAGQWTSPMPRCLPLKEQNGKNLINENGVSLSSSNGESPLDIELQDQQIVTAFIPPNEDLQKKRKQTRDPKRKRKKKRKSRRKGRRKSIKRRRKKNKRIVGNLMTKNARDAANNSNIAASEPRVEVTVQKGLTAKEKRKRRKGDRKKRKNRRSKGRRHRKGKKKSRKSKLKRPPVSRHPNSRSEISNEIVKSEKAASANQKSESDGKPKVINNKITDDEFSSVDNNYIYPHNQKEGRNKGKKASQSHPIQTAGKPDNDNYLSTTTEHSIKHENFVYQHHTVTLQPTSKHFTSNKSDLLQDIINKIEDPTRMQKTNLFDLILKRRLQKENMKNSDSEALQISNEHREDAMSTVSPKESTTVFAENSTGSVLKEKEIDFDDSDYEPLPDGYPDVYNTHIGGDANDTFYDTRTEDYDLSLTEDVLDLDRQYPKGYPSPEERLYDENEVKAAQERFVEEEQIAFSDLDTTCVISELDALYLPPPRMAHGHVTTYRSVTNPAAPNNVYAEAAYECDFGFQLVDRTSNRLFCRKNKWIGIMPVCASYETEEGVCGDDNGGCEHICQKVKDAFFCSCYRGFTLGAEDGASCRDVDECLKKNGGCEGACYNKLGSHQCYCPKGYRLATNGKTCVDKNECNLRNGHGPCQDTCYNSEGSYYCTCDGRPGTKLGSDNHTCEDVDECALDNGGCSHICLNTFGQTFCGCPEGFSLSMDWKTCKDINECDFEQSCEHGCENTPGSYRCTGPQESLPEMDCEAGLRWHVKNQKCEDINECDDESFGCSNTCINTHGSAHCECPNGFRLQDDKICSDIDECSIDHPCSHVCENLIGSYKCSCPLGMVLSPDNITCIDINECADANGGCEQLCVNQIGSFNCQCNEGFALKNDEKSCQDVDECETNNGDCDQLCSNTHGDFFCSCISGYELEDDFNCIDIDECGLSDFKCQHLCQNFVGSYNCFCHDGYEIHADNITCIDIDECGSETNCSHFCTNEAGSYVCKCPTGWALGHDEHICHDTNECDFDNGGCSHFCRNVDSSYRCECPKGMAFIDEGTTFQRKHLCVDVDECASSNGNCSHICVNVEGTFACECPDGMKFAKTEDGLDEHRCVDIDECAIKNGECSHRCVNREAGFVCQCPKGLKLNPDGKACDDVDECSLDNGGCSHSCINLPATYECTCPTGWDIDYYEEYENSADEVYFDSLESPWKRCIDVNECDMRNGGCSHECVNKEGGFFCSCPKGYNLINNYSCEDIDECIIDNGGCSHSCVNTDGSFECSCPNGFTLEDFNRCVDVDECEFGLHDCSHKCKNELGSYSCSCQQGFIIEDDNKTCTDFNECGKFNGGCSHKCQNLKGQYTCSCTTGFLLTLDNHTCADVNECDHGGICSHICSNTIGSFSCLCPQGLELSVDSTTCIDVNECGTMNNGGCSHQCTNSEGHYTCLCPTGTTLGEDKHTCLDVNECEIENGGCSDECLNLHEGYKCLCPFGYRLDHENRTCEDVDECLTNNGGCFDECHNVRGSFRCECDAGFKLAVDDVSCDDINECEISNGGCSHSCGNIFGSFLCTCPPGYSLDSDKYRCIDLDECQRSPCEHDCFNTPGSFYCSCRKGFQPPRNSTHLCRDTDECQEKNAGCGHSCVNTVGSYQCKCDSSFKLASDEHSCERNLAFCPLLIAPPGGQIRCSHDLYGSSYREGTVCSFVCPEGSTLYGDRERTCSSSGFWTNEPVSCQAVKCSALTEVERGRLSPGRCIHGTSAVGQKCYFTCMRGYRVIGNPVRTCTAAGAWQPGGANPFCEKETLKPFIQCPNDVTVDLAPHQKIAYVRLPPPKSNVEWYRFVEASPEWAKQLESDLPAGRTTVTFMAQSPISEGRASCSFVVFVRDKEMPQVFGCPKSFHVYLSSPDDSENVTWKEPDFKDNVEVVHIYKSMEPGKRLTVGTFPVHYIAVDAQGNRAKCSFVVTVEAAPPVRRVYQPNQVWVVCPGTNSGSPVQMNVWRVPQACTVVKSSPTAHLAHWDSTLTHLEAPDANRAPGASAPQRSAPTPAVSAYGTQLTNTFPYPSKSNIVSSATAFSSSSGSEGTTRDHKQRHHHGFEHSPFAGLFGGSQPVAVAHARARGGNGNHETTAFTHTRGNDNTQAIAHARARVYNYN